MKPRVGSYKMSGEIIFNKAKGFAYFYKLINASNRHNSWGTAFNSSMYNFVAQPLSWTYKIFSR